MPTEKYGLIREAILNRMQVTGVYKGRYRELCPYKLGHKNGREQALFGQFGGESSSAGLVSPLADGAASQWRCMHLSDLTDVTIREGEWYGYPPTPGGGQPTCVGTVDLSVEDD